MQITLGKAVVIYLITLPIFFVVDLVWLGVVARDLYQQKLAHVMKPQINWGAAIAFYLIFIVGIVIFAIRPALEVQSAARALAWGALFGFFTYATYDLTNLATIRDWPLIVTVVDLVWGTVLCATVAWVGYSVSARLL
jgi:uncharacterized membrane protein